MEFSEDTSSADRNPFFVDAWGNPLFFLRNGNVLPRWTMGMIDADPLPEILGPSFREYLTDRAARMFPRVQSNDPDDPENLLVSGVGPSYYPTMMGVSWLTHRDQRWLAPTLVAANRSLFAATFGYRLPVNPLDPNDPDRIRFAPFVIISGGGDGILSTWEDNLDSYRLRLSVSNQQ